MKLIEDVFRFTCWSAYPPLAILLKITFIIYKEKKPTSLPLVRAGAWEGRRSWADPARHREPVPGYCSAEFSPGSAKPRSVLGTGSWLLCTALPEPGTAGGSELGPADVTNTYACHEQKGQEKSWRGSDLFSLSGVGRWAGGREKDGTSQHCCSFKAVFVGMPLLGYYCYQKGK